MNRRRHAGTSLIELLVVIVILLIGILGILQLFPAGFSALRDGRDRSQATELARGQLEYIKGRRDTLAEMILPVRYQFGMGGISILADTTRSNFDLGPAGQGITQVGQVLDDSNNAIGPWQELSGSNIMRRVVGEGGRVPAPRNVNGTVGGLMVLNFSPIVYDPAYAAFLRVYGNDLIKRWGQPFPPTAAPRQSEYFVSDEDVNGNADEGLFLADVPFPASVNDAPYRLSFSFFVDNGGNILQREVVEVDPAVLRAQLSNPISPNYPAWRYVSLPALINAAGLLQPGDTLLGVDEESIRVQRTFLQVNAFTPGQAYEFQLLDPKLGVLLFNPAGYNFTERRPNGTRVPLVSKVNYDVQDWRILRHEFRVPQTEPANVKLPLGNLMVRNGQGTDGRNFAGISVPVSNGAGGTQQIDVILLDVDTGGVYLHDPANPADPAIPPTTANDYMAVDPARSSYVVDKSLGLIRLLDADRTTAGMQLRLILPGAASPTIVNADGRRLRALFMGRGEWAVQILKAPNSYQITNGQPGVAQCYVGTSNVSIGGDATRIYFPGMDVGKKVTIGEIWYQNAGVLQILRDQDFLITANPADPLGYPYIDINTVDAGADNFDFSNGYAIRTVKGASVAARVLWNPTFFSLVSDPAENLRRFEQWARNWRRTTVETYLERSEN